MVHVLHLSHYKMTYPKGYGDRIKRVNFPIDLLVRGLGNTSLYVCKRGNGEQNNLTQT